MVRHDRMTDGQADAHAAGATVGLLIATDAGLLVYERLGWTVLAPWTTAQLKDRP